MDPERWQRVQQIFNRALARPSDEWPALLDAACSGDRELRREVEELLLAEAEAEGVIEAAVAGGAELVASELPTVGLTAELPAPEVETPARFGKYVIETRVGEGGFGVVYKGLDPVLQRTVAIKTCSSLDADLRKRFFREAQIAAGLQHPNITTVHDLGVEDGVPYLVQEFLVGEDLEQVIDRRSTLSTAAKLDVLLQIARGLEHAHSQGVLHRDVKPANVRLLTGGGVKIMDFGIAKLLGSHTRLTGTGMAIGTVGYLAPEQLRSEELDERADVFSFGVLAYELLTLERPFQGDDFSQVSYQLLYVEPPPLEERWPAAAPGSGCPTALDAIVRRCLEKDRLRRYRDFSQVIADLEPLHELLRSPTQPGLQRTLKLPSPAGEPIAEDPPTAEPAPGGSRRRWIAAAAVLLAALVAAWSLRPWERIEDADQPIVAQMGEGALSGRTEESPVPALSGDGSAGSAAVEAPPAAASIVEESAEPRTAGPPAAETRDPPRSPPATGRAGPRTDQPADRAGGPPRASGDAGGPGDERESPPEPPAAAVEPPRSPPADSSRDPVEPDLSPTAASPPPSAPPSPRPAPRPTAVRGALLTPGPGVVPPKLLERPKPEYPRRARRRKKQTRVIVRVLVDENGQVAQAVVPRLDPFGFLRAAREAALEARYEPATRDGVPGKMWTELPFQFRLQ